MCDWIGAFFDTLLLDKRKKTLLWYCVTFSAVFIGRPELVCVCDFGLAVCKHRRTVLSVRVFTDCRVRGGF